MYLDANNLHGWGMSENLPVDGFKWVKDLSQFNEDFTKKYDKNSNKGYFLEADAEYTKKLFNLHKGLPFLSERKKVKKLKKLICNVQDKEKYVVHIRDLKQALNHGLELKRVHRVIRFNQKACLKPYIEMNTKIKKRSKQWFWKRFL